MILRRGSRLRERGRERCSFHPNNKWVYCVTELKSTVDVLHWDGERGAFEQVQTVKLLPAGYKGDTRACDIVFDRKGQFAYVANRDNDFMASFTVSEYGRQIDADRADFLRRKDSAAYCAEPEQPLAAGGEPGFEQYLRLCAGCEDGQAGGVGKELSAGYSAVPGVCIVLSTAI